MTGRAAARRASVLALAGLALAGLALAGLALAGCGAGPGASAAGAPTAGTATAGTAAPGTAAPGTAGASPATCPVSSPTVAPVDGGLPDLTLGCLAAGPPVRLAGLRGRPLVVTVWASWCPPCRTELPWFATVAAELRGRVDVLGIDASDDDAAARALLAAAGGTLPSVVDPGGATRGPLRWSGLPLTLFVHADGTVAARQVGAVPDLDGLRALVSRHLGVEAGAP